MVVVEAMLAIAFSEQTANFPERPAGFMTGIMQNRGRGHGVAAVPACVHSLLPTDLILTLTACGNDQRPPERPRRCMIESRDILLRFLTDGATSSALPRICPVLGSRSCCRDIMVV